MQNVIRKNTFSCDLNLLTAGYRPQLTAGCVQHCGVVGLGHAPEAESTALCQ